MAAFYFVYFDRLASATDEAVNEAMNKSLDWYRINKTTWIHYSSSDPEKIYARLAPLVKDTGNVFICELNIEKRQGWMKRSFWDWLKKER